MSFRDSRYARRNSASTAGETSRGKSTVRHSSSGSSKFRPAVRAALARICPLPMELESMRTSVFCEAMRKLYLRTNPGALGSAERDLAEARVMVDLLASMTESYKFL